MKVEFRFVPPRVEVTGELRWLLWRAFGPPGETLTSVADLDTDAVKDLARRLDLAARVGARTPPDLLAGELTPETTGWFREQHSGAAARCLLAESVCRELAEAGRLLEIPLVFLKGAALQLGGRVEPGSRNMGDIDVLAPETGARRLQEALVEVGCEAFKTRESEHQLQYLAHRAGLGIEVHKIIPGVRLGGESSATADGLMKRGLVRPAPGLEDDCYLPNDTVLLAHVLVHGIAQHGLSPQAYPMMRMLADVQDLGVDDDVWRTACGWIERDASRGEVEATARLAGRLGAGDDPAAVLAGGDHVGALLRHLVAGVLDGGYGQSLKFRSLTAKPKDIGRVRAFATTLRGALLLTNAQVEKLYGPPRTELGYWGWRLWRPFDLVLRAVRYGWAWLRHRIRMRN
jgi:hypothetical protein